MLVRVEFSEGEGSADRLLHQSEDAVKLTRAVLFCWSRLAY